MLQTLQYLRQHGIAHRAVNPFNICFYSSRSEEYQEPLGLAKLIDFGQSVDTSRPIETWTNIDQQKGRLAPYINEN